MPGFPTRQEHHDRADWAAIRAQDGAFLGEAVLNEFDPANESANYRVWLAGPHVFGQGYGTEITRLVVDYALGTVGLHRVSLGAYDFNPAGVCSATSAPQRGGWIFYGGAVAGNFKRKVADYGTSVRRNSPYSGVTDSHAEVPGARETGDMAASVAPAHR